MKLQKIVIDNTKNSAVESEHWNPNIKDLIESAVNSTAQNTLLREMFLVRPKSIEIGRVAEYKYPHHAIVGDKCVLDVAGVKAAYARAKQQGIYEGAIKEHLDQHREELGLMAEEAKKESITNEVDKALSLLKEALRPKHEYRSNNMFSQMFEKPIVTPAENGTPVGVTQPQAVPQPQAAPIDVSAAPAQDTATTQPTDQPTIPVQNVNPAEDTSTNNPIEGPDDRDQDNLDGIQRKEMYQQWADLMMQLNSNNVFGTIFDQDVFKSEYKIVPYEMRYFYRLQNPVSVTIDDLSFIPFGTELLEAQDKYGLGKKMFVFATNNEKPIFFNMLDKTIWFNDTKLNDSFDGFIEQLTQNNGELQIPEEGDENQEAEVDYQQNPDVIPTDQAADTTAQTTPDMTPPASADQGPIDLSQNPGNMTLNTGLEDNGTASAAAGATGNMAPVDLTAQPQNASVEYDSIADYFDETGLFESSSGDDNTMSHDFTKNDTFSYVPGKNFDGLKWGSTRKEVHNAFGDPKSTFKKSRKSKNLVDNYGSVHVYYDDQDKMEFVEVFEGYVVDSLTNYFPITVKKIRKLQKKYDNISSGNYDISDLYLTYTVEDDEVKAIGCYRPGYYKESIDGNDSILTIMNGESFFNRRTRRFI